MTCDRAYLRPRQRRVLEAIEKLVEAKGSRVLIVQAREIAEAAPLRLNRTLEALRQLDDLEFIRWTGRRGRGCYSELVLLGPCRYPGVRAAA